MADINAETNCSHSPRWVLAQYNEARLRAPIGDPMIGEFVAGIAMINRLADASEGFIWRHHHGHDESPQLADGDDRLVVNLSLWRSYADLHRFLFRSVHGGYVRRRTRWFVSMPGPKNVLWWVTGETRPTIHDGRARLDALRRNGPTPAAFTMRSRYDSSGRPDRPPGLSPSRLRR